MADFIRLCRYYLASWLITAGLSALPPGRVKVELHNLISAWSDHVRETVAKDKEARS